MQTSMAPESRVEILGEEILRNAHNPVGLDGMEFLEFASPDPEELERLFYRLGFRIVGKHRRKNVFLFRQGRVNFILNKEPGSFSEKFFQQHGPSICAQGFRVKDSDKAYATVLESGAKDCNDEQSHSFPTVFGIGNSAVYFVDKYEGPKTHFDDDFEYFESQPEAKGFGMEVIDHMTNNVPSGKMQEWCDYYKNIYNFREVRYFSIRGEKTGLESKVMRSPCNKITIPINEPSDQKSQIQEYLDEYHGEGIQHVALLTNDIVSTVRDLRRQGIEFLDVPDSYYDVIEDRIPQLEENLDDLRELKILVDGDEEGYLLQIFTKNLIGPIFFEIIERKNHSGFGEGNFQALFDAIERDQAARGVL